MISIRCPDLLMIFSSECGINFSKLISSIQFTRSSKLRTFLSDGFTSTFDLDFVILTNPEILGKYSVHG